MNLRFFLDVKLIFPLGPSIEKKFSFTTSISSLFSLTIFEIINPVSKPNSEIGDAFFLYFLLYAWLNEQSEVGNQEPIIFIFLSNLRIFSFKVNGVIKYLSCLII